MKEALTLIKNSPNIESFFKNWWEVMKTIDNSWKDVTTQDTKSFINKFNAGVTFANTAIEVMRAEAKTSEPAYAGAEITSEIKEKIANYRCVQPVVSQWIKENNKLFTKNEAPSIKEVLPKQDDYMKLYDVNNAAKLSYTPNKTKLSPASVAKRLGIYGLTKEQIDKQIEKIKLQEFEDEIKKDHSFCY